jgi:hypothetical protein
VGKYVATVGFRSASLWLWRGEDLIAEACSRLSPTGMVCGVKLPHAMKATPSGADPRLGFHHGCLTAGSRSP